MNLAKKELQSHLGELIELAIIVAAVWLYAGSLLDFDPTILQQSGEQNESATRALLVEYGLNRNGEIPLWNHFMQTGFPYSGDLLAHFWSPVATLPVILWGGINGMKVSVFLSFLFAGIGQWYLAKVIGVKGVFRVWAAIMFTFSGGVALLWRLGWYELLVGAAWFPWVCASFWQALHKKNITSMIGAAFCASMVLLSGGGYYPFYLGGGTLLIFAGALLANLPRAKEVVIRGALIAIMVIGLTAVMTLPIYDGYRLITRDIEPDYEQEGSQPVTYSLINYLVSDDEWFHNPMLGAKGSWNWFYIGPTVFGALFFLVYALRYRKDRTVMLTFFALFAFYLLWIANRYSFFKYVYDFWPFLYELRFPSRLLIFAASPLLAVSAYSLQSLLMKIRSWLSRYNTVLALPGKDVRINLRLATSLSMLLVLFFSAQDLYKVNQEVAIVQNEKIEQRSYSTLNWLKKYDYGMYYVNIGGGSVWWNWLSAAYDLEIPTINFVYSQYLESKTHQQEDSPFYAKAKYQISSIDEAPANGVWIADFDGVILWLIPDALPFAFSTETKNLQNQAKLNNQMVTELASTYSGPNRVLVQGEPSSENDTLIVLVSNYPGWKLLIDQKPANLKPVNGYLGASMLPGNHIYSFVFDPPLHRAGLAITILTLAILLFILVRENYFYLQKQLVY